MMNNNNNTSSFECDIQRRMEFFPRFISYSKMDLKKYQVEGVEWCLRNELRENSPCNIRGGFVLDEMGLGKTITMIGVFLCHYLKHTLIVVPPLLVDQWYEQIYRTTGHKSFVYYGNDKKKITIEKLKSEPFVITTYNIASVKNNLLHQMKWSRIVFDEAHHLRNSNTTRYSGIKHLRSKIRWLVSGTPVQNSMKDFYNLCAVILMPKSFYRESMNMQIIAEFFILKRTKKQVGIEIPELIQEKKIIDWKNLREMELSKKIHSALNFNLTVRSHDLESKNVIANTQISMLPLLIRARQSCVYPKLLADRFKLLHKNGLYLDPSFYKEALQHTSKLDFVVETILQRKGNDCGKLVFCHFHREMDEIANRLSAGGMNVSIFDGRTTHAKRQEILKEKKEVIILQIQTGCEGLNLQENYSEIYFVSPHWNPSIEDQAIARCHRIGQTKNVFIKRFEMQNFVEQDFLREILTIENYIRLTQERKRLVINKFIENIESSVDLLQ